MWGKISTFFPKKGKFSIIERVFYLKKFSASERSASTISLMNLKQQLAAILDVCSHAHTGFIYIIIRKSFYHLFSYEELVIACGQRLWSLKFKIHCFFRHFLCNASVCPAYNFPEECDTRHTVPMCILPAFCKRRWKNADLHECVAQRGIWTKSSTSTKRCTEARNLVRDILDDTSVDFRKIDGVTGSSNSIVGCC